MAQVAATSTYVRSRRNNLEVADQIRRTYENTRTYSGCDITATVIYDDVIFNLNTIQTISVSSHTARVPVRVLGIRGPNGFTTGTSTYAGTMIITLAGEEPLIPLVRADPSKNIVKLSPTQLPPFNIVILFSNEYDDTYSKARLWRIRITDQGYVTSVNDMITEVTYQYVAEDYDVIQQNTDLDATATSQQGDFGGTPIMSVELRDTSNKLAKVSYAVNQIRESGFNLWSSDMDIRSTYHVFRDYIESGNWSNIAVSGARVEVLDTYDVSYIDSNITPANNQVTFANADQYSTLTDELYDLTTKYYKLSDVRIDFNKAKLGIVDTLNV